MSEDLKAKVEAALDKVRPALANDGGGVELVDVTAEGEVQVRLQGHCYGCPFSQMTVRNLVEKVVKQEVPEVTAVVNIR
ncbi:NifU family protein [Myxococcota bacterium]|nr:NifU family protein [Myxococcota bacterium]MBU1535935.1 NifU family protein [Myxococcota bacterium]